ncbi:MAG TPA: hypothetical protein VJY14_01190 [Aliarcobacter sp.]|nr:hypothetical protein [Aliarcobacter sp.]
MMCSKEFGLEKIDNLYCIWKKENGKIYWLNIKKNFELYRGNRAGVRCFDKAKKLMMEVCS